MSRMNDVSRSGNNFGRTYDRYGTSRDTSTLSKVQQQYWTTKQAVYRKLGKKEDEHVVASDSQLDSKLELFFSIRESSAILHKTIEQYQDKLLALSQSENALGRFLKENGKIDKTRAGKMMTAVGKTMSYSSQQRLAIHVPLIRLHQEVETFRFRAISDTMVTVNQMETSRTDYRGALLWMKDASQELDPDTYKQLDKFRKVQMHVRKTKGNFEKYKLDCLQKIDLLAASRCNMFSHALATYQNTLLHFWEKTSRTMAAIAESFKGYQHYEFSMLKELTEVGKKLTSDGTNNSLKPYIDSDGDIDKDRLIFFEDYHDDDEPEKPDGSLQKRKSDSLQNLFHSPRFLASDSSSAKDVAGGFERKASAEEEAQLLNLVLDAAPATDSKLTYTQECTATSLKNPVDLLTNSPEIDDMDKDNMTLLKEILNSEANASALTVFDKQWDDMFNGSNNAMAESQEPDDELHDFMPSQLLDIQKGVKSLSLPTEGSNRESVGQSAESSKVPKTAPSIKKTKESSSTSKKDTKKDISSWFSLFADLDPLANPDAIGKPSEAVDDDRNC